MSFDLSLPRDLTLALAPDLLLFAGAIVLMLWAAWRPESDRHQRAVGVASLVLTAAVLVSVVLVAAQKWSAGNGVIAVDNVLRGGRVLDPKDEGDRQTAAFNDLVQRDPRVTNVILTIRDGVMLIRPR